MKKRQKLPFVTIEGKQCLHHHLVCSLQNSKDCLSIILVTEDATDRQIATLMRILKQMSNEIPDDLVRLSEETIKGREQDKQNKLCSHLKAFGKCMYV